MVDEYMAALVDYPFEQVYADIVQFEQMGFFHLAVPAWVSDLLNLSKSPIPDSTVTVHVMSMAEAVSYGYKYVAHAAMKALGPDVLDKPAL